MKRRRRLDGLSVNDTSFNPRLREEATQKDLELQRLSMVSIHASVKRRLKRSAFTATLPFVSIHASVKRRRDTFMKKGWSGNFVSIHASVKRRHHDGVPNSKCLVSIHASVKRRHIKKLLISIRQVSIHASVKRRRFLAFFI